MISISLLTAISIDRYLTFVNQEFTCSQRAWYLRPHWLIFFAWGYGTSQNLPVFHTAHVVPIAFENSSIYYCTTTQGSTLLGRVYLIASVLLGFVIPLATMVVSYYRVIRVVWTRNRRLSSSVDPESYANITNAKVLERSRKRVLRVLLIVVICFVTCWLPFGLYHGILERYLKEPPNPMDAVRLITYGVGLANSTCNPFIYYFNVGGKCHRSMKRRFVEIIERRARTSSQTLQRRASPSSYNCSVQGEMMELGFFPDNISDNNFVEFAFINEIQDTQDTRL